MCGCGSSSDHVFLAKGADGAEQVAPSEEGARLFLALHGGGTFEKVSRADAVSRGLTV